MRTHIMVNTFLLPIEHSCCFEDRFHRKVDMENILLHLFLFCINHTVLNVDVPQEKRPRDSLNYMQFQFLWLRVRVIP